MSPFSMPTTRPTPTTGWATPDRHRPRRHDAHLPYDVLGRQTADAVTTLGSGVNGTVRRLTTAYNSDDPPYLYTSYNAAVGGTIVNQVEDVYDGLGQLTGEYQEQAGAVNTSTSAEVQYAYTQMSGGQNNSRLTQMVYPNGRTIDDVLQHRPGQLISRLSAIADDNGGSPGTTLEGYSYLGLDTIVQYAHPEDGINLTYIQQTGEHQPHHRRRRPVHRPGPLRPRGRPGLVEPDDRRRPPTASSTATTATGTCWTRTTW